jgi:6-phosphogluconolactonase (cycloisomerase 2 family)
MMKKIKRILALTGVFVGLSALPAGAWADAPTWFSKPGSAVFVQTNNANGNAVVAYTRGADGALTPAGTYPTGGLGGQLAGSVADHLASQGSLTYDTARRLLYAVNAGSDTVTVFSVRGDGLRRIQTVPSGGSFPVSVAIHGDLVYVLNALDGGAIQGFIQRWWGLFPAPSWNRSLGLDPTLRPQFVNAPGEVGFTPDGRDLIVTTKANGDDIDVFRLDRFGEPSGSPVVNAEPGTVPFGFVFGAANQLLVAEPGPDAVQSFSIDPGGSLTAVQQVPTGQGATCWIVRDGRYLYTSNAGSASVSGLEIGPAGLSLLGSTSTDAGTIVGAVSSDGRDLYVQTGVAGVVDEYAVGPNGRLTEIGSVTVPNGVGQEGIVAP